MEVKKNRRGTNRTAHPTDRLTMNQPAQKPQVTCAKSFLSENFVVPAERIGPPRQVSLLETSIGERAPSSWSFTKRPLEIRLR